MKGGVSSLGVIATSAIFAIMVLISLSSLTGIILLNYDLLKDSLKLISEEAKHVKGDLKILSMVILPGNRSLEALILNDGAGKIRVADFEKIDLILVYREGEAVRAEWLPYDPDESLGTGWKPLNITYGGCEELINPAPPDFSSGIWDSGEVLAIRAWTESAIEEPVKLIMVSPRGVESC
ncbi:MAG: hypothetical protein DRN61_05285 [Thaumarchaeota archaeon]|nr:MAG: hypothetical protein DRN61_05285 [Nitrososphaerota archaeon]HDD42686.1 hypothetical protein [Nitrososphaeria archaeon]